MTDSLTPEQRAVIERIRANPARTGPKTTAGEDAARLAHDEGLTYAEASARTGGVALSTICRAWQRLYPDERRRQGRRP